MARWNKDTRWLKQALIDKGWRPYMKILPPMLVKCIVGLLGEPYPPLETVTLYRKRKKSSRILSNVFEKTFLILHADSRDSPRKQFDMFVKTIYPLHSIVFIHTDAARKIGMFIYIYI
ncbi:MAG TPA: hypothetical protein DCF91_13260 [Porphyromonadaceae bacterium]|nr:hypothetical protein [Porphyromonadaceae bacterium]